jgi:hypothetical protein
MLKEAVARIQYLFLIQAVTPILDIIATVFVVVVIIIVVVMTMMMVLIQ